MIVNPPFGSPCDNGDPVYFTVDDCDNPEAITWEIIRSPAGSNVTITHIGDNKFEMSFDTAGAYIFKGTCS